ncbi:MAG: hypothetical protein PVI99_00070 [Anaerolineales bacterium]
MFNFKLIFGNKYHKDQRGLEEIRAGSNSAEADKNSAEACCCSSNNEKDNSCSKE